MYYFYKTTNLINGKYYYGSGTKKDYFGSGKLLLEAILKYGIENFKNEKLRFFESRELAFKFEERFLSLFNIMKDPNSYNLTNFGSGGNRKNYHGPKSVEYREHSKRVITEWNMSDSAKEAGRQRMIDNNPMNNPATKDKCINALSKWRKENQGYWLNKKIPNDIIMKISKTRKEKKLEPYNKGITLARDQQCDKCNRIFTKPGFKKHIITCK